MTILTHVVIGSLVGAQSPNLVIAAIGGIASHFISDFIPHNDYLYYFYKPNKNSYTSLISKIILVATGGYLLSIVIFMPYKEALPSLIGAVFAALPDVLTGLWTTLNWKPSLFDKFHGLTHNLPTIAEYLYNRSNHQNKILREDNGLKNMEKMRTSGPARFGWLVEIVLELAILGLGLGKLWIKL